MAPPLVGLERTLVSLGLGSRQRSTSVRMVRPEACDFEGLANPTPSTATVPCPRLAHPIPFLPAITLFHCFPILSDCPMCSDPPLVCIYVVCVTYSRFRSSDDIRILDILHSKPWKGIPNAPQNPAPVSFTHAAWSSSTRPRFPEQSNPSRP